MSLPTTNTILIVVRVIIAGAAIPSGQWSIQLMMLASLLHSHHVFHGKKRGGKR